jgi:hypothetical protein
MIFTLSCKKENSDASNTKAIDSSIVYPELVYVPNNILAMPDSAKLTDGGHYGMGAILGTDAVLTIVMNNLSLDSPAGNIPIWGINVMNHPGWVIGGYDWTLNTQRFTCEHTGKIDCELVFMGQGKSGKCRIDIYENKNEKPKQKYIFW